MAIQAQHKDLEESFQQVATKIYQQAGAQGGAQGFDPNNMNMGGAATGAADNSDKGGDDVIDAEFTDAD